MLTQLNFSGSHFEVGVALGRFGQKAFYSYRQQSDVWQSLQAFKDQAHFHAMGRAIVEQCPDYWVEFKGLPRMLATRPLLDRIEFYANHCSAVEIKALSAHVNHVILSPMQ